MPNCARHRTFSVSSPTAILCALFILFLDLTVSMPLLWGATSSERTSPPHPLVHAKASKVNASTASPSPVTIHNVRVLASPQKTRLVLDLDRYVTPIERRAHNPSRVIIALPNTSMSREARAKTDRGALPNPFTVTQTKRPDVAISVSTAGLRTYKQFTLSNPPRVVVDVTYPSDRESPETPGGQDPSPSPVVPSARTAVPPHKSYTTIVIDPGHGGKDTGALGRRHTEEKDVTLKVALQLRELLRAQPGVQVLMTRDRDVFVELDERTKFANSHDADLFVSIHVNSHPSHQVKGIEVYHFGEAKDQRALEVAARENGTPLNNTGVGWEYLVADLLTAKKIERSMELAWTAKEAIVAQLNGRYPVNDHGVKTAPFYVLRFTSMPSILAEIAYISNPDEEDLLRRPSFVQDIATALFKGIISFISAKTSDMR